MTEADSDLDVTMSIFRFFGALYIFFVTDSVPDKSDQNLRCCPDDVEVLLASQCSLNPWIRLKRKANQMFVGRLDTQASGSGHNLLVSSGCTPFPAITVHFELESVE